MASEHSSTGTRLTTQARLPASPAVKPPAMLPKVPVHYEIAAGSIAQIAHFPSELGISIKEIPQVIGEQVSFGLNVAIPAGIAAALNGAKLQIIYRNNLVKRT